MLEDMQPKSNLNIGSSVQVEFLVAYVSRGNYQCLGKQEFRKHLISQEAKMTLLFQVGEFRNHGSNSFKVAK